MKMTRWFLYFSCHKLYKSPNNITQTTVITHWRRRVQFNNNSLIQRKTNIPFKLKYDLIHIISVFNKGFHSLHLVIDLRLFLTPEFSFKLKYLLEL